MIPFSPSISRWLFNCLHGDFGKSYSLNKPVVELLAAETSADPEADAYVPGFNADYGSTPGQLLSALHKDSFI